MIYRGFKIKLNRSFNGDHIISLSAKSLKATFHTDPIFYFTDSYKKKLRGLTRIMMSNMDSFKVCYQKMIASITESIDYYLDKQIITCNATLYFESSRMTDLELWCIEEKACIQDKHDQIAYALESSKALTGRDKQLRLAVADDLLEECNKRLTILNEKMKQI